MSIEHAVPQLDEESSQSLAAKQVAVPEWHQRSELEIQPYELPDYQEFISMCRELYGPGLTLKDYLLMRAALWGTYQLNKANRNPFLQKARELAGIPLPAPSCIERTHADGNPEMVLPRPWELYLAKTRKSERRVGVSNNIKYNVEHPDFIPELTLALVNSNVFSTEAYHSYLRHVVDPTVGARLPYRRKRKLHPDSPNGHSVSVLHIRKDGSCLYFERPIAGQEQFAPDSPVPHYSYATFDSYDTFQKSGILDVQVVINQSTELREQIEEARPEDVLDTRRPANRNRARSFRKSSLLLLDTAAIAVDVKESGELSYSFDHLAGDGRPVAGLVCEIGDVLSRFEAGVVPRPTIDLSHGVCLEMHSDEADIKQCIALEGLPEGMSYTDMNLALLLTLHEFPGTAFADFDADGTIRPEAYHENKTVSGTVTADYPIRVAGDSEQRQLAQETNRVNIFGTSTQQNFRLLNTLQQMKRLLIEEYGANWLAYMERSRPQQVEGMVPDEMSTQFIEEHREMRGRLKKYIAEARRDGNTIQLAQLFYGIDMDQAIGDTAEHLMPDAIVSKMHAHAVHTRIEVNRLTIRPETLPHLETVTPLGQYGVGGKVVLGTITSRPHSLRDRVLQAAREKGDERTEAEIWREMVLQELIPQFKGTAIDDRSAQKIMRQLERLVDFTDAPTNVAETHMISWYDSDPVTARHRAIEFSARFAQNAMLLHHLNRGLLRKSEYQQFHRSHQ